MHAEESEGGRRSGRLYCLVYREVDRILGLGGGGNLG